jgi:hypothetical protein
MRLVRDRDQPVEVSLRRQVAVEQEEQYRAAVPQLAIEMPLASLPE